MLFAISTEADLNAQVLRARQDDEAMEAFIRRNKRFILGVAYKTMHRFITESDDEWSIALIAFHEAVRSYDMEKGAFKQFAGLVIKRRLLDYAGSQARTKNEVSADFAEGALSDDETPAAVELEVQRTLARQAMEADAARQAMRDEIEAMQQTLGGYGFSFYDLAECSPKAHKTKAACARAIRALMTGDGLMEQLRKTGALPAKAVCEMSGVPRKILENHRRYIIAAAEILYGDYPQLAEYLRFVKEGGESE